MSKAWTERAKSVRRGFLALRSLAGLAVIWYLGALWIGNPVLMPTPLATAKAFIALGRSGDLLANVEASVVRLLMALVLAVLLAVPLGILLGLSGRARRLIDPTIELIRPISGIAWIPIGLFLFGVGNTLPVFIMIIAAFFPLLFNTAAGVQGVDARLVAAARTMGLARASIVRRVVLPAAAPGILVGFRLAVASAWTAIVAAELIGAPSGVGFAIEWYRELLMSAKVFSFIAVIGGIGFVSDLLVRKLQQRLAPWAAATGLP